MSMNLAFISCTDNKRVAFPYQTTTEVSEKVMKATTIQARLQIIESDLWSTFGEATHDDVAWCANVMDDVEKKLNDPLLRLVID